MPKIRSKRGAQKRFKLTGKKKVKRYKAFSNHILTKHGSNDHIEAVLIYSEYFAEVHLPRDIHTHIITLLSFSASAKVQ